MLNNNQKNILIGFLVSYLIVDWGSTFLFYNTNPKFFKKFISNLNQPKSIGLIILSIIMGIAVYKHLK